MAKQSECGGKAKWIYFPFDRVINKYILYSKNGRASEVEEIEEKEGTWSGIKLKPTELEVCISLQNVIAWDGQNS